jgi:hypothetical protein
VGGIAADRSNDGRCGTEMRTDGRCGTEMRDRDAGDAGQEDVKKSILKFAANSAFKKLLQDTL